VITLDLAAPPHRRRRRPRRPPALSPPQSLTLHLSLAGAPLGDLKLEVYCEEVPRTAANFLALAASGAYDGTRFHRSIRGFMLQGGDPTGTGKGGRSIYDTPSGKFPDEIVPALKHARRGVVSMANSGPNTNGSQFFITYKAAPHLDGRYTVFAHAIDGLELLDKVERVPVGPGDRPTQEIRIERVTIHANPVAG
jgi:peptidyl-prolyl cis-trans isomerase-like 3